MKYVLLALLLQTVLLFAEASKKEDAKTIFYAEALERHWERIEVLEGEVQTEGVQGFSTEAEAAPPTLQVTVGSKKQALSGKLNDKILPPMTTAKWRLERNGSFYMDWVEAFSSVKNEKKGISPSQAIVTSWNGELFSEMRTTSGNSEKVLSVKHGLPDRINAFTSEDFLTMPFRFIISTSFEVAMTQFAGLDLLEDNKTYADFAQNAEFIGMQEKNGHAYAVLEVGGGVGIWDNCAIKYRIFLDPAADHFPVIWDEFDAKLNTLRRRYEIKEIGKVDRGGSSVFLYPKSAEMTYYKLEDQNKAPSISVSYKTVLHSVKVNKSEDFEFILDPASASIIYDLDSKTSIRLPKY